MIEVTEFESTLAYYKSQHKTVGCKITHMIGVPMIAVSVPMLIFRPRRALNLFLWGCLWQVIGHWAFEKNKPVLTSSGHKAPLVMLAALVYVTEGWINFLSGKSLIEPKSDQNLLLGAYGNGRRGKPSMSD